MEFSRIGLVFSFLAISLFLAACQPTGRVVEEITAPVPTVPAPQPTPASAEAIPSIMLVSYPSSSVEGSEIPIGWRMESQIPMMATHTSIHYGVKSFPGQLGTDIGPAQSPYPSLTSDYASGSFTIPEDFLANIAVPASDNLYLRAHAIVDGKNYWTDEYSIAITPRPATAFAQLMPLPGAAYNSFVIEADDAGFYPAVISVGSKDDVRITFRVRAAGVDSDGLEFRVIDTSSGWGKTDAVMPGNEATVYFTPTESFTFGAYRPGGNLIAIGEFRMTFEAESPYPEPSLQGQ